MTTSPPPLLRASTETAQKTKREAWLLPRLALELDLVSAGSVRVVVGTLSSVQVHYFLCLPFAGTDPYGSRAAELPWHTQHDPTTTLRQGHASVRTLRIRFRACCTVLYCSVV